MTTIQYHIENQDSFRTPIARIGCIEGSPIIDVLQLNDVQAWHVRSITSTPIAGESRNWVDIELVLFAPTVPLVSKIGKLLEQPRSSDYSTYVFEMLLPYKFIEAYGQGTTYSRTVNYSDNVTLAQQVRLDTPFTFNKGVGNQDPLIPTIRYQSHGGDGVFVTNNRVWDKAGLSVREGKQPWFGYEYRNGRWVYADSGAKLVKALESSELLPDMYYFDLPTIDLQLIPATGPLAWFIYRRLFTTVSVQVTRALFFPTTTEEADNIRTLVEFSQQQPSPSDAMLAAKIRELNLDH